MTLYTTVNIILKDVETPTNKSPQSNTNTKNKENQGKEEEEAPGKEEEPQDERQRKQTRRVTNCIINKLR